MWKGRGRSERALVFFPFCDSARKQRGQTNQCGFLTSVAGAVGGPTLTRPASQCCIESFYPLNKDEVLLL